MTLPTRSPTPNGRLIAAAARQEGGSRGAKMSRLTAGSELVRSQGKDPDGNPFSLSHRV